MLASIESQTFPAALTEVLLVDNHEAPEVEQVIDRLLLEKDWRGPQVHVLHAPKPGSYAARNIGIRNARGKILAFTDVDCRPDHRWLEHGLHQFRNPDVSIVAGAIVHKFNNPQQPGLFEVYDSLMHLHQEWYVAHGFAATANLMVRRPVFEAFGEFDEHSFSGSDAEWGKRVTAGGEVILYCGRAAVSHETRHRLATLVTRSRRGVGGAYISGRRAEKDFRHILRAEVDFARLRFNLLRQRYQATLPRYPFPTLAAVWALLHLVRVSEIAALSLGAQPERR